MSNWCVGTLRVRGLKEDVQNFLLNELEPHDDTKKLEFKDGNVLFFSSYHIKDTERGQISYVEAYLSECEDNTVVFIALDSKFAGLIKARELLSICQKYDIDMRIYGFERGTQVNQDIEIINNEISKNELTKYNDHIWDCILPELGG